jgi:AhpC/TSA antioxidant enzyme
MFCREMVAELRQVAAKDPDFPDILIFGQGSVEQSRAFFAERWPEARAVADPRRRFYNAFGIGRGSLTQLLASPGVVAAGARAVAKGHIQGQTVGDAAQMPGLMLVQDNCILWQHRFRHAGDHPNWEKISKLSVTGG